MTKQGRLQLQLQREWQLMAESQRHLRLEAELLHSKQALLEAA